MLLFAIPAACQNITSFFDASELNLGAGKGGSSSSTGGSSSSGSSQGEAEMVQCELCGGWYEAGNVFRNHICPGKSQQEMVQCEFCGGWYEAGNEFRNHICPGKG